MGFLKGKILFQTTKAVSRKSGGGGGGAPAGRAGGLMDGIYRVLREQIPGRRRTCKLRWKTLKFITGTCE